MNFNKALIALALGFALAAAAQEDADAATAKDSAEPKGSDDNSDTCSKTAADKSED